MRRNSSRGTMPSRILTLSTRVCAGLLFAASPLPAADSSGAVASAVNDLGLDLLAHATEPQENTVLSPYSVQSALTMVYAGASGETRRQMAKLLHYAGKDTDVFGSFASLQRQLGELTERTTRLVKESRQSGRGRASR